MNDRPDHPSDDADRPAADGDPGEGSEQPLSVWQVVASTLAAAFGVQSSRNRERDFTRGKPLHFIIAGIVFTVIFVVTLLVIVNLVL